MACHDRQATSLTGLGCLLLTCLALAACGGGDSKQDDASTVGEARDPRAGYFHATETRKLSPPLDRFNAAWAKYAEDYDACNNEVQRLHAAGASPRKQVQCHIRGLQRAIDPLTTVRAAVGELDGDYRMACDTQIKRFGAALDKVKAAWQRLRSDWNAYASSGVAPSETKMQQHTTAVTDRSQRFWDKDRVALSDACYTKADRTQG
jgi:hypothetical protein